MDSSLDAYFLLRHYMLEYQPILTKVTTLTISARFDEFDAKRNMRRLTPKFHP